MNSRGRDLLVIFLGFAVGVILLGQAPAIRLSARVRDLEKRLPPSGDESRP